MDRKLLDIEEAAELLGVAVATLYRWSRAKRVPCIRIGPRVIRFDPRALDKFIASHTSGVQS
jgi:excisionase family DNA binding protein